MTMENIKATEKDGTSTENKIQQEMFIWFNNTYTINKLGIFASVPNDSKDAKEQMRKKATGMKVGHADFNVYLPNGKVLMFEVKTLIGKQSDHQKRFELEMKYLGFEYYIVRSLEEFKNIIETKWLT